MRTQATLVGSDNVAELKDFLASNKLPNDDIQLEGNQFILYRDASGKIIGSGGLEFYDDYCLLRSVAVTAEFRNHGLGENITRDLIQRAKKGSARGVYLLTETAQKFFEKFGFQNRARDAAPNGIKSSSEFSSVCPVSAVLMSIDVS